MYIWGTRASSFRHHVIIITGVISTDTSATAHLTKEGRHDSEEYMGFIAIVKTDQAGRVYIRLISPLQAKEYIYQNHYSH